jgi:hypothetical protein
MRGYSAKRIVSDIGYALRKNVTDVLGGRYPLGVYPASSGGGVNYFESDADLIQWVENVEETRKWQDAVDIIWPD